MSSQQRFLVGCDDAVLQLNTELKLNEHSQISSPEFGGGVTPATEGVMSNLYSTLIFESALSYPQVETQQND